MEDRTVTERKDIISSFDHQLSVRRRCDLLEVNRSRLFYKPVGESKENLDLMAMMDKICVEEPTFGVLRVQDAIRDKGFAYNHKRIRRLLRKMGIEAIYPKRNLSKLGKAKYVYPYLLRGLEVKRRNQVWEIDITYIPLVKGFLYLTAIIDVYSRYIVGWQISNTLAKETQTQLLQAAINQHGKPEIINSDQGSQYTSSHWVEFLKEHHIKISMDGKGRATDNCFIERFFRTLKWDHVYLYPAKDGLDLYSGVDVFIKKYNTRSHQGIERRKPIELYKTAA